MTKGYKNEASRDSVEKLKKYLASTDQLLSTQDGRLNKTAIAKAAGLTHKILHSNPVCAAMIKEVEFKKGVKG